MLIKRRVAQLDDYGVEIRVALVASLDDTPWLWVDIRQSDFSGAVHLHSQRLKRISIGALLPVRRKAETSTRCCKTLEPMPLLLSHVSVY